jgi:serine/threonine protein kinase
MEYVAGGSISSLINRYGKFKESLIKSYVYQILKGLEYLHSHGVIHRDIKGANLLIDNYGVCKLVDFGCSKKLSELS